MRFALCAWASASYSLALTMNCVSDLGMPIFGASTEL